MVKPDTLHIHKPFGRTILLSILFFPFLLGFTEAATRLTVPSQVFPPPSVGSPSPEFDIKIDRLNNLIRQEGEVPCILFGSSMINGGIDPIALSASYASVTGSHLTCFNFALNSLVGEPAGPIADLLVRKYQPRLMIIGVSPRDFSSAFGEIARPLLETEWLWHVLGRTSREGWLIDNSLAYRYYLGMQNWKNPENREVIEKYQNLVNEVGYEILPNQHKELVQLNEVLLTGYELNMPDVDGFRHALSLNNGRTQVILLEMPVHPAFFPYYIEGGEGVYNERFLGPVAGMAAEFGVPFWRTQENLAPALPADGWNDRRHLNHDGAQVFSTWLGEQIATAVQSQAILNPHLLEDSFFPLIYNTASTP